MGLSLLVATDLSPRADRAVARTLRLAAGIDAAVTVLFVIDDALPEEVAETLRGAAETRLERFVQSLPFADKVAHVRNVSTGDPAAAISTEAAAGDHDLLVLGMHRPRPFMDLFLETTMERVVRTLDRPVLLVRDAADHDYARILAATDFGRASTAAMRLAARLAPDAEMYALHAVHVPYRGFTAPPGAPTSAAPFLKEAQADMHRWRDIEALPKRLTEIEIVEGPAGALLRLRVETLQADLLTIGAHSRAGPIQALLGSLSRDLIRTPPCDLLVAR